MLAAKITKAKQTFRIPDCFAALMLDRSLPVLPAYSRFRPVTAHSTIDDVRIRRRTRESGRRTNPLRSVSAAPRMGVSKPTGRRVAKRPGGSDGRRDNANTGLLAAGRRFYEQLPAFAPLLEELEIAGWTAPHPALSGSFHDWLLLGSDRVLVTVGQAVGPVPLDPIEAALVAQAAWTAVRAHAQQADDAGALLALASRTLWPMPAGTARAAVAVALIDTAGGQASVALAGECSAWRVRAATSEPLVIHQPPLGGATEFSYQSHSIELSLRERLILVAGDSCEATSTLATIIAASFTSLDAESHRRMTASEAVALIREQYEHGPAADTAICASSASIAAIRRR